MHGKPDAIEDLLCHGTQMNGRTSRPTHGEVGRAWSSPRVESWPSLDPAG